MAITAAESGHKIYFGTLTDLVDSLEEAKAAGRLNRRLTTVTHPAPRVVDEIGCLPVTQSGAILFFQLVNRRYGRASTVLASNKDFEEWSRILGDETAVRKAWTAAPRSFLVTRGQSASATPSRGHSSLRLSNSRPQRTIRAHVQVASILIVFKYEDKGRFQGYAAAECADSRAVAGSAASLPATCRGLPKIRRAWR